MMTSLAANFVPKASSVLASIYVFAGLFSLAQANNKPAPPTGIQEVCAISFDKDPLRPARVENSALPCLKKVAGLLSSRLDRKLVLVGVKDPSRDHESPDDGREEEDATGFDVRLEDLSAYRAVNVKWYLVRYLRAIPTRIIPTTDESYFAQTVTFYLVPASADYNHNFLGTTKTNEKLCTVKPCYSPDEESLAPQHRPQILPGSVDGSAAELQAEQKALWALKRGSAPADMDGARAGETLAPLLPRPTPDQPATTSVIPK